jgi:hypothetical protein
MQTIDIEMPDEQAARLDRFAMSVHKSPREATAQLIEEGLRHAEFPAVEFRDSDSGRQAYVVGSSLAVWEVAMIDESYGHSAEQTAAHLRWPVTRIEPVLAYARTYPQEIAAALLENRSVSPQDLQRSLPNSRWT